MFTEFAVTIPSGTELSSPHEEELKLSHGIICDMEVEFPAGCLYTVYFVLDRWGHKTWPEEGSVAMRSEDHTIKIKEHYPLTEAPYSIKARGWSPDAQHDHTIHVRITILPEWIVIPTLRLASALDKFFKLIPGYK